nr:IPT/TIG domain-containing protein [Candidatus Delongbacteria bacterium]
MKSIYRGWKPLMAGLSALIMIGMAAGCSDEYPDGVYDPNDQGGSVPVISSVTPATALAGVDPVTITVTNLNPVDSLNKFYFNNQKGTVLSITDNGSAKDVSIYPPLIQSDSVIVKVMVPGAFNFGQYAGTIKVSLAAIEYGGFGDKDDPVAVGCDKDENVYVTMADKTVRLITPDKPAENTIMSNNTAPANTSLMKIGNQNMYFVVTKTLYSMPLSGGTAVKVNSKLVTQKINDFDFAPDGSIYYAMKDGIGRMLQDGNWTNVGEYPKTTLYSIRVFNGAVYAASKDSVW